ncbi:MAG TPA: DUF3618 domain-containing protein [Candidatus Binatia bacterium]
MPNSGQHERTPNEVQEEIEQTRAELDSTLDEIGRRLSPQEMKERVVDYVKSNASRVGDTVQRNPVPIALAGTLLVATVIARRRLSARKAREREEQFRAVWERLSSAIERPHAFSRRLATSDAVGRMGELAADARSSFSHFLDDASTRARDFMDSGRAQPLLDRARPLVDRARPLVETLEQTSRTHPLASLGVALAAGALLVTLLRRS